MTPEAETGGGPLYRRLQIPPEASGDDIGRAYRRLAHDVHPDSNPDDPEAPRRFQELTEAYEVLSDTARRARYDQLHANPTTRLRPSGFGSARAVPGSVPLLAGPVHVDPPIDGRGPRDELLELLEALFEWGGWS
jgi:molecular chaperone DnaJ